MFCFGPLSATHRPSRMYAPKFYHHQQQEQTGSDDADGYQHQMVPQARKTPLSAGKEGKADGGAGETEGMKIDRAKSFLAFISKWAGLGKSKTKDEWKNSAKRVCYREEEAVSVDGIKSEEIFKIASTDIVENALDMASCLAEAESSDQAIYGFGEKTVMVTRVSPRIEFAEELGKGSFARVYKGFDSFTQKHCAIKLFNASMIADNPRIQAILTREIECLRVMVGHPNVVQFQGLLVTKEMICILTEYLDGDEFFAYISSGGPLAERKAKPLLCQLAETIEYIHDVGIVHRDLKLENLMVVDCEGELMIKVIDFGLARDDANDELFMATRCGSQEYAAPEILLGHPYNPRLCDAWSFGVIMYTILFGTLPFSNDLNAGPSALTRKIVSGVYCLPEGVISRSARSVIKKLLVVHPEERLGISDAIKTMPFFM